MLDLTPNPPADSATLDRLRIHTDVAEFFLAAAKHCLLLIPDGSVATQEIMGGLHSTSGIAVLHVYGQRRFIGLNAPKQRDLDCLVPLGKNVLIRRLPSSLDDHANTTDPWPRMPNQPFRIFFETGSPLAASGQLQQYREIGLIEFLLSSSTRLCDYPSMSTVAVRGVGSGSARMKVVIVLDLIQDFEVLRPLVTRCAQNPAWSNLWISVSDRVMTSHLWPQISVYIDVMQIRWFKPISPLDVVNVLGSERAVLITASESSANGHKFSHTVCQLAHRKTFKITVQHGYECVGLRHHQAHDASLPQGVRFASDVVFTWSACDQLTNMHSSDRAKCIPVGIVKSGVQESAVEDHIGQRLMQAGGKSTQAVSHRRILIAENLHSVRFVDANRYQRFLEFIRGLEADRSVNLTLRSHPGKRTLERDEMFKGYAFLTGTMRAQHFHAFDVFVSPPSTIVLDAVLAGVPTAIWSVREELGDCENYAQIPVVNTCSDIGRWLQNSDDRAIILKNYQWALDNICAVNGTPQAWSRMNELVFSA
jgi:hypothetical protein